ncbi:FR47-like protein [Flavobacterium succinicans]|uniref:FR47-like protein n=2 Tax=Flavobacterium TaxID=237 RepID=A0A1I4VT87_9FLAO|nr:GNAT family N-acetyltransferase [Flavobacterium succinicans]SFN04257.1 FR47-like protein [Flavobacterium succinicans]
MVPIDFDKLDYPIGNSIKECHSQYGLDFQNGHFYLPDYCPFGDFSSFENAASILEQYLKLTSSFYIFGNLPEVPSCIENKGALRCCQMILTCRIKHPITETIIKLGPEKLDDLLGLVRLVYPEYFKPQTTAMGNYYGIYKDSKLVAVTGERMQMNDFIEVSAVITHPDHTGKGYAKQLVTHTANAIFDQNKFPFLHVARRNSRAIHVYESLGFSTRKEINIWHLVKKQHSP